MSLIIRNIELNDNVAIAVIIRNALKDFGADLPGTVYYDHTTDDLYTLFQEPRSAYFIALSDDKIVGGGGYFPTEGLPPKTCELGKMYIDKEFRGKGIGKLLLDKSMESAKNEGYQQIYLETLPQLNQAVSLYEKNGFQKLKGPMGNSGHFGCNMWMIREL